MMEVDGITAAESANYRSDLVWIEQIKGFMAQQRLDPPQSARSLVGGLDAEPLVDHQRLMLPFLIELRQRLFPQLVSGIIAAVYQLPQRRVHVGHIIALLELLVALLQPARLRQTHHV